MKDAIKAPGTRTVGIKLHSKVTANMTVKIVELKELHEVRYDENNH